MNQIELPLFQSKAAADARLEALKNVLRGQGWLTARVLKVRGFSDRELRDLVEHSEGQVLSFPGSPGYKLFDEATVDEISKSKALFNQGRSMVKRWLRYQRRLHRHA
jgi:hypothetical protein